MGAGGGGTAAGTWAWIGEIGVASIGEGGLVSTGFGLKASGAEIDAAVRAGWAGLSFGVTAGEGIENRGAGAGATVSGGGGATLEREARGAATLGGGAELACRA